MSTGADFLGNVAWGGPPKGLPECHPVSPKRVAFGWLPWERSEITMTTGK